MKTEKFYDFTVLGAGGTGLAAAMYAARMNLKTLVLGAPNPNGSAVGGTITTTNVVENYPGFVRITGIELAKKIEEHARSYDLVDIKAERVTEMKKEKDFFNIKTNEKNYKTKTILFATGAKNRKLEVKGSKEFENKGVSSCALCDAFLYKNKVVAVIGGSDSAAKTALLLSEHCKTVYLLYRGNGISPEPINLKRVNSNKKIKIITQTNILEIKGKDYVESLMLDKAYKNKKELKVDGLFFSIGSDALSDLAQKLKVKLNNKKEIIIDHKTSRTNIPGVFAAGDVTDKPFKQLITGVADGCTAAYSAYEYIRGK